MELKGSKAVVTGGGSGYGKGIAAALVDAGAKVWITGRNEARLKAAASEIGATPIVADVANGADWDRVFETVGDLDILVNNAGFDVACGITGAAEDAELAKKCIQPADLGRIVLDILSAPDRLAVPELTVQPMIQEIIPM